MGTITADEIRASGMTLEEIKAQVNHLWDLIEEYMAKPEVTLDEQIAYSNWFGDALVYDLVASEMEDEL